MNEKQSRGRAMGQIDMFNGPILPMIMQMAVPVLISYIVNYLYLMVDTYFISMIDRDTSTILAGTGLIFPIEMLFESVASSMAVGLSVMVGRFIGEKKYNECQSFGSSGIVIGLCIGIPFLLVCYLGGTSLVRALGGAGLSDESAKYALQYMYSMAPGVLFMILSQVIGGILVGQGLAIVTTKGFMIVTILNCILDPIFIFGLKLGVVGAGLATLVALFCSFIYILLNMKTDKARIKVNFSFSLVDKGDIAGILSVGIPQLLMTAAPYVIIMVYNKLIVDKFGEDAMNAWALTGRIDQLLIIPIIALSSATVVFASQNFGRKLFDRIHEGMKLNLKLIFVMCIILATIYVLLSTKIFGMFTDIDNVSNIAVKQVRITSFTYAFMAVGLIAGALFQAINKPIYGLLLLYFRVILIIALGFFFVFKMKMNIEGVFYSIAIGNVISLPVSIILFSSQLKKAEQQDIVFNA